MAGQVICVSQQKGGSGKTTVSAHLAVALALADGEPVALLDIDPQGSLGEWFEAREELMGEEAAGFEFRTASGWGARREARNLARHNAFVIVDTPPKSESDLRPAIEASDLLIVPIQPSPVDLWATRPTLELAEKERKPSLLVMNRVPPRASLTEEVAEAIKDLPSQVATTRLGNRTAFAAAMGAGQSVQEREPRGKAAEEIAALVLEIRSLL